MAHAERLRGHADPGGAVAEEHVAEARPRDRDVVAAADVEPLDDHRAGRVRGVGRSAHEHARAERARAESPASARPRPDASPSTIHSSSTKPCAARSSMPSNAAWNAFGRSPGPASPRSTPPSEPPVGRQVVSPGSVGQSVVRTFARRRPAGATMAADTVSPCPDTTTSSGSSDRSPASHASRRVAARCGSAPSARAWRCRRPGLSILSGLHASGPVRLSRLAHLTDMETALVEPRGGTARARRLRAAQRRPDRRPGHDRAAHRRRLPRVRRRTGRATDAIVVETFSGWSAQGAPRARRVPRARSRSTSRTGPRERRPARD